MNLNISLNMSLFCSDCHASVTFVLACVLFDFDEISSVALYVHINAYSPPARVPLNSEQDKRKLETMRRRGRVCVSNV